MNSPQNSLNHKLREACRHADLEGLRAALKLQADPNDRDPQSGWDALDTLNNARVPHHADPTSEDQKRAEMVQLLIDHNASLQLPRARSPLHSCLHKQFNKTLEVYLQAGIDPNHTQPQQHTIELKSPLHTATKEHNAKGVELLLQHNANPRSQQGGFQTRELPITTLLKDSADNPKEQRAMEKICEMLLEATPLTIEELKNLSHKNRTFNPNIQNLLLETLQRQLNKELQTAPERERN